MFTEKLDWEECEKIVETLNVLFDLRIKERAEQSIEKQLPMVDEVIKNKIMNGDYTYQLVKILSERIERDAKSAADHHIRLFGGCVALREIVGQLWDAKKEQYIEDEVNRRFNTLKRKMMAAVDPEQKS